MGSNSSNDWIVPVLFLVKHRAPDRRRLDSELRLVGVNWFTLSPPSGEKSESQSTPTTPFPRC